MTPASRPGQGAVEPLPENLFREPIDCLHADHFRQRIVCDRLDGLVSMPIDDDATRAANLVLQYLERDFPLHLADEEEDLLPFLRTRLPTDAGHAGTLAQWIGSHHRDDELRLRLLADLRRAAAGHRLAQPMEFTRAANEFVAALREHLAWEENAILPQARRHLAAADLEAIGQRMAARRGIPYPEN